MNFLRAALVFLIALVALASAEIFVCPTKVIKLDDGATGKLPIGATEITQVPRGVNCSMAFDIPKGYAVQLEITTDYDPSQGDEVSFNEEFFISPSNETTTDFGVGPNLSLRVHASSIKFTFEATYTYIDLKAYSQVAKSTGEYFLGTLEPLKYFTVQASKNDTVAATISMRNTGFFDQQIHDIFVFDGNDTINSNFIGRLGNIYRNFEHSSGEALTFVNFHGSDSNTFIIGNDYSKIQPYKTYRLIVVDGAKGFNGIMTNDYTGGDLLYTYICDRCDHFYINNMTFDMTSKYSKYGFVEFRGMSPSQDMPVLLNYTATDFSTNQLPQLIPSPIATARVYDADVAIDIQITKEGTAQNAQNQDSGAIISPTLWNTGNDGSFDYIITSMDLYDFAVSFSKLQLSEAADKFEIKFMDSNGITTFDHIYNRIDSDLDDIKGSGSSMSYEYTGSKDSQIILEYTRTQKSLTPSTGGTGTTTFGTTPLSNSSTASTGSTTTPPPIPPQASTSLSSSTFPTLSTISSNSSSKNTVPITSTPRIQTTTSGAAEAFSFSLTGLIALLIFN